MRLNVPMSTFDEIKKSYLKQRKLWEDPDFPADQSSLFYHHATPFKFQWVRPKEITSSAQFLAYKDGTFDAIPGKLGDRWFLSCLGILYLCKGFFYRVVPANQSFDLDYAGIFRFRFWWCGKWEEVIVDDRLPVIGNKLVFLQIGPSAEFWPLVLEKAYAKLHGSYEALKYGCSIETLMDLTGGITEKITMDLDPTFLINFLSNVLNMTSLVTCVAYSSTSNDKRDAVMSNGIAVGASYRIDRVDKITNYKGEIIRLVRLQPPPNVTNEYTGNWRVGDENWNKVLSLEHIRLGIKQLKNGQFWMSYSEFLKTFTHLELVHVDKQTSKDEPSLSDKDFWNIEVHNGFWQRGVTAGGCRNNSDTFYINPQLYTIVAEKQELLFFLSQSAISEPKVMGFSVFHLSEPLKNPTPFSKAFFKKSKSFLNSQYTNSKQISHRCLVSGGHYIVLPTTFEPGEEADFTFRILSKFPVRIEQLDFLPSVTKSIFSKPSLTANEDNRYLRYYSTFLQLADECKRIGVFELQELLDACLPNDYVKSCASIEVCRELILSFDDEIRGKLQLSNFKEFLYSLKHWQAIYKNHTKEKSGILRAERLRDCLEEVGFQLSTEMLSTLMLRYMRKDGTFRFGDFILAVLHLNRAFSK